MKNSIAINIGLARKDGQENTVPTVAASLRHHGLILTHARIVRGEWQGKPECTLAVEALCALPLCHEECRLAVKVSVQRLAAELSQDCIAVQWPEGHGELIPPVAEFDATCFHSPRCVDLGPSFL